MGRITWHYLLIKNDNWLALDVPLTYPITVGYDFLGKQLSATFNKGETLKTINAAFDIKVQLYDNNNGTFSLQMKTSSPQDGSYTAGWMLNGKQLYNFWYEGNRYNKGMPDWPYKEIKKPFPTSSSNSGKKVRFITSGIENITSYEGLRKYVKSINGNKETSWQPMTDLPETFQIMINGRKYKKTVAGANGNSGYALHVPSGQNDMVILGLHDVDANKDVIVGSTNTGGNNWGWFPTADGKVYITNGNSYNDSNKTLVTSGEKILTLERTISPNWYTASSLSDAHFSLDSLPIGERYTLAVGDTTNETRGEGDHTQYNGSKIRSFQYKGIHDYNGTLPMGISSTYILAAFFSKNVAEIEITVGYGVGNKDGNYAWWKITSPNGQHKQVKINIKVANGNAVYTINNHVLGSGEKYEFDSFKLWNTTGHYYITKTSFGLDMSINVSVTNKNEPCYMYPHEVKYKVYE